MQHPIRPWHLHTNFHPDGLGTIENMMDYAKSAGFKSWQLLTTELVVVMSSFGVLQGRGELKHYSGMKFIS